MSILLARSTNAGGHVLWFSRGILDLYEHQLTDFYNVKQLGHAPHPKFPADWRPTPTRATPRPSSQTPDSRTWQADAPPGEYFISATQGGLRRIIRTLPISPDAQRPVEFSLPVDCDEVELVRDRRIDLDRPR
jgi:hypothetical protein